MYKNYKIKKNPLILGIETSCDDTSVAIIRGAMVLGHLTITQHLHRNSGGVVPELASRYHQKNLTPSVKNVLTITKISPQNLDAISFTRGPGLIGSLLVGSSFAKSLAMAIKVPSIGVNHIHAHIMAHFINYNENIHVPTFPFICLTVSGGHTKLVRVDDYFKIVMLGQSLDDAAGEAFDKTAKILGLNYPGGILIQRYAKHGNIGRFSFFKPKIAGLNFSFSGLKTQVLYFIKKKLQFDSNFIKKNIHDICAAIQNTIVEILLEKLEKAVLQTGITRLALSGGVSANIELRSRLLNISNKKKWDLYLLPFAYTTDNAVMIAISGYLKYKMGIFDKIDIVPINR